MSGGGDASDNRRTSCLLSLRVQLLLTSCQVAKPSTMALWKYSVVVVSFISLSLFLLDSKKEHLEYSISLVRPRN